MKVSTTFEIGCQTGVCFFNDAVVEDNTENICKEMLMGQIFMKAFKIIQTGIHTCNAIRVASMEDINCKLVVKRPSSTDVM